jgi:[ribosomal protein S18]-alanine N-acetyltransferase
LSGVVTVRPFRLVDLPAAARFSDAIRALDPAVEPFGQRLGVIATGPRAALDLWQVAAGEDGGVYGLAFAAARESERRAVYDFYAAVHPSLRRQGLGRALAGPAVASSGTLRARVRDDAAAGRAFLRALGFTEAGAQLMLQWTGGPIAPRELPALRIRRAAARDEAALKTLSERSWKGAADDFPSRADEIAQLFAEEGRLVLVAESEGNAIGYLSAVQLGWTLGIEEVAVLPAFRRMGIARALLAHALRSQQAALLSVGESNAPARALYRSAGFRQAARRLLMERRRE